jgi:hypothetical protein
MNAALIDRLSDPNIDVRRKAAEALGTARARNAVRALASSLDGRDVTGRYASTAIQALASIGSRDALPTLERWARSASTQQVRENAARAYIAIAKPSDTPGETRRLLWEQPDTALEQAVLTRGKTGLPLAWQALATGSTGERRAAAALLGWFPDRNSIRPVLAALAQSPGALTRDQLLFDLNMILLADGSPADGEQGNALAAAHLRWLYGQLANQPIDSDIRAAVLAQKTIAVFPDRVVAPRQIEAEGKDLAGAERNELVAAALSPQSVDRRLLPQPAPQAESILEVRRAGRFGVVAIVFDSGPRGGSGYSMLFDRRGDRWIFLCLVKMWIS